jgi:protein SCO1/2
MASWYSTVLVTSSVFGALLLAGCSGKPPLPSYGVVPDFTLTDQNGGAFNSAAKLDKKIWIADFIFTNCPGPCPRMSSQMHQVQTALAGSNAVRFVSFTVDPARDTPPVLAAYAQHFEATPGKWYFLTGAESDLNRMSRGVFMLGNVDGSLEHSTRFTLIDGSGRIRGYYLSSEPEAIPTLIADTKRLLKEQS